MVKMHLGINEFDQYFTTLIVISQEIIYIMGFHIRSHIAKLI